MRVLREVWARIRYLFRRESEAWDLDEELEAHLEMAVEANVERGMSPEAARRLAHREFGNRARVREAAQEAWLFHWLESVALDIRYGLRQFRKAPGFFFAVVASLAIGLGANTAIFSLIEAAVLRPLPIPDPDRLIQLGWRNDGMPGGVGAMTFGAARAEGGVQGDSASGPLFRRFAEEQTPFESFIGIQQVGNQFAISAAPGAPAEQVRLLYVSRNFFDGLGVPPAHGRSFLEEEDRPGAELAIVVSHRFWSSRLGRDPEAIGRVVRIDDEPARIVGVAAPGFFGLNRGEWIDVYQPLATSPMSTASSPFFNPATYWSLTMLARVAPDVSVSAVTGAMTPLFRNLVAETTGTEIEDELELVGRPAGRGLNMELGSLDYVSQALSILMLLVGVLLLIVCANVANLLLSRSETRRRESAVRLALGAGRRRLIRQHLVESGMLAVIGGAAGLGLGIVLARSIHVLYQTGQGPGAAFAVVLDWRVAAYAAAISVLTALIFGLAPAWTAARSNVNDALKIQSRSVLGGGLRVPRILVSAQFALSFAALVAAGLLGRSLGNLYSTDLGFDGEELSYATVRPTQAGYAFESLGPYLERVEREIAAIPGVLAVAPMESRPLDGFNSGAAISAQGGPPVTLDEGTYNPEAHASVVHGGPRMTEVLGIPLLAGRTLEARDQCAPGPGVALGGEGSGPPICRVVVDERFAEVFFPGEAPVGQRFEIPQVAPRYTYEVVGLVANARLGVVREEALPTMYNLGPVAFFQHFAIRAQIDSRALATAVGEAIARVDPSVPMAEFHTQDGLIDRLLRIERLLALVSRAFSLAALILAAVGLAGLLAYAVARRTNEIGIRMALGATGREVRRMVLGDSLWMVGAGILIGIPAAYAVGRYLESQLFGLEATDPSTALLALAALLAIAAAASFIPARRAARVDPLTALRDE
jgi:predicted permease